MSDDPETARQIALLAGSEQPLLVLDVDDVLIEFIRPFPRFLETQGYELRLDSFRLTGNIFSRIDGVAVERERVSALTDAFYVAQADWQGAVAGAVEALERLSRDVEIVMLTAMPHRHRDVRRTHLDRLRLPYPLLTTEMEKGPAVARLRGPSGRPVAFVDDQPRNLVSVKAAVPDCSIFHLMADVSIRSLLPSLTDGAIAVDDWSEAATKITAALGVPPRTQG